jgi:hypothetical protein
MADIFQEVDEALKHEKVVSFWKENGPFIIACVVTVIVTTAVVNGYRAWDRHQNVSDTSVLLETLEEDKNLPGRLVDVSRELRPGHRGIALLLSAGEHLGAGNSAKAQGVYEIIVNSKENNIPRSIKGYARLMSSRLSLENRENRESGSAEEIIKILQPLLDDPSGAWHWHALEQAALVHAHITGDLAKAIGYTNRITASDQAPETLIGRAAALESVYKIRKEQNNRGNAQ